MNIRKATLRDAEALRDLYFNHLTPNPPEQKQDMNAWRDKLVRFERSGTYHLLVGEIDGTIVSSVTLVIIENLTNNCRPYAIIENVVTHTDYRHKGYAKQLMARATEIAEIARCYKIMLLSSSKFENTTGFYGKCGFDSTEKAGFIKRL